ncbi:MAG: hypothetical protein Q8873_09325, partial [Bacillota bacterium]|nr:hypothetical protein [Bacillota bacterium]
MFIHKHFDYKKVKDFAPMVREYEVLDFEWIFRKTVWGMLFVGLFMDLLQPNSIYKFVYSIILT